MNRAMRLILAGWLGGFAGNAFLGAMFSSVWIKGVLYDPAWQSRLFLDITPQRNIAVSVAGLIVLSGLHGIFFHLFKPSIPGRSTLQRGLYWGLFIWATYWLFQEWFIYITLLREPVALALIELVILLVGSLIEGWVIAIGVEKMTDSS
ncbi:MAG: hypothetical protein HY016_05020 [Nitrosomonadales bacterium]|nr:hypothetical protein [Nitrosomonadales bacterium]